MTLLVPHTLYGMKEPCNCQWLMVPHTLYGMREPCSCQWLLWSPIPYMECGNLVMGSPHMYMICMWEPCNCQWREPCNGVPPHMFGCDFFRTASQEDHCVSQRHLYTRLLVQVVDRWKLQRKILWSCETSKNERNNLIKCGVFWFMVIMPLHNFRIRTAGINIEHEKISNEYPSDPLNYNFVC